MKISISDQLLEQFPNFCRGVVVASSISNYGDDEELFSELNELSKSIRKDPILKNFKEHPNIMAWRQAFEQFQFNPNANPPSIANLIKRVSNGAKIPFISKVVCIFNIMSMKHLVPLGGDDLNQVTGDLCLTYANGDETYTPLGKPMAKEEPKPGEVIYYDTGNKEILCRGWCWRNSDQTKILPQTTHIAINVDGLPPTTPGKIKSITQELATKITTHCGGKTEVFLLSKENATIEINI